MLVKALTLASLLAAGPALAAPGGHGHHVDEYDYIVVGSGPGGGPLAVNLAKEGFSVLLLEAGDLSTNYQPPFGGQDLAWDFFVKHYEEDARNKLYSHGTWRTQDGHYWVGKDNPPAGA